MGIVIAIDANRRARQAREVQRARRFELRELPGVKREGALNALLFDEDSEGALASAGRLVAMPTAASEARARSRAKRARRKARKAAGVRGAPDAPNERKRANRELRALLVASGLPVSEFHAFKAAQAELSA